MPPTVGEENRRMIVRAKHEADDILAKANSILEEAKSVQTSFDNDVLSDRAKARRIGYDEGFRAGRAHGSESGRMPGRSKSGRSGAVQVLTEAAGRLREALERFESDRKRYLKGLKKILRGLAVGVDGEAKKLPKALVEFMGENPPQADLRPEDEIWLEKAGGDEEEREPSLAVSGESGRRAPGTKRSRATSGGGRGRRRRGEASR